MSLSRALLALLLPALVSAVSVPGPELQAKLDYGTFQGKYSEQYNISYWRKIPFAAPPLDELRFRGPQPPVPVKDVYDTDVPMPRCPQNLEDGQEDCLYLGLYSRPWRQGQALRPVVVYIHGGGYFQGSAGIDLPPVIYPGLNVSEKSDFVLIEANYRVNVFGFLAGKQIVKDSESDTNVGLLDQRAAMIWANKYAQYFGGDPEKVTIWGHSSGGGSVVAQSLAGSNPGGENRKAIFTGAVASSPFWQRVYHAKSPESQWVYDTIVNQTECVYMSASASPNPATDTMTDELSLTCLKKVEVKKLLRASSFVLNSHKYKTSTYTWAPVLDDDFLKKSLSEVNTLDGVQNVFGQYLDQDGHVFVPKGLGGPDDAGTPPFNSSEASFGVWLAGFLPGLNVTDLENLKKTYPLPSGQAPQLQRAGFLYRDLILACPAYWLTLKAPGGKYLSEYSISPSRHGADLSWWNLPDPKQQSEPIHYKGITGAITSFLQSGDPNKQKLTGSDVIEVPHLDSGKVYGITPEGFKPVDVKGLKERCDVWMTMAAKVPF